MAQLQFELLELQRLAERTGLPIVRWHLLRRQASLAALVGNFDNCRRLGRQAAEVAEPRQDISVRYTHLAQTVCLALLRRDPTDIDPQWTEQLGTTDDKPPVARAVVAAALLLVGREDEAYTMYRPLVASLMAARTPQDAAAAAYLPYLALAFGDKASCRMIRDWLVTTFGASLAVGWGTVFYQGSVARILGRLDLATNETTAAVAHFEAGLAVDSALGARPFVAEGQLGLAQALLATGEVTRGTELGRAAAAEARRLDMPGLLGDAEALLANATATARAADPLTRREREVLALVAQAMSNREVANALVLSERTVESHVRSILAKTGLTTRIELVRWYLNQPS